MNFAKHTLSLGLALAATGLISCSIPKPECTVGQAGVNPVGFSGIQAFSTRYVLVSGTGPCADLKGDVVGIQSYHPATGDGKTRDFSKTSIAIRPHSLGELLWMTEDFGAAGATVEPNALGDFTATDPDDNEMCQVPTLTPSQVVFTGGIFDSDPEYYPLIGTTPTTCKADADCSAAASAVCRIAEGDEDGTCGVPPTCAADADCGAVANAVCRIATDPAENICVVPIDMPATDLKYEWSNVDFYVTAAAPGTQFSADVDITLNGCKATYRAIGMWPAVDCTAFTVPATETAPAIEVTGDELCDPEANGDKGRPVGSGINPDFGPVACESAIAVVPVVDAYYSLPDIAGGPLSVPRCAIMADKIPALEGSTRGE